MPLPDQVVKVANERIMLERAAHADKLRHDIEDAERATHLRRNTAGLLPAVLSLCEQSIKGLVELVCKNLLDLVEKAGIDYTDELADELKIFVDRQLPEGVYQPMIKSYFQRRQMTSDALERKLSHFPGIRKLALRKAHADIDSFLLSLKGKQKAIGQKANATPLSPSSNHPFVDLRRLQELKAIINPQFDLTRLIRLCEELNTNSEVGCYFSIMALTRTIIDHVPPIFGVNSFSEVANNYPGSKSFKDSMKHLSESSRKIADAHLHTQIRTKEILPAFTQVNFSNDLDVLLAEIIRILK